MNRPASLAKRPWSALVWGWGLVLVVLLSAAPTGGPPRTQLVGSAFDPASVSVALNPRQPKVKVAAKQAARPEPGKFAPEPHTAAEVAARRELAARDRVAPAHSEFQAMSGERQLVRSLGARAPPLA